MLFLFGTMLTRARIGRADDLDNRQWPIALVVALVLAGTLGYVLIDAFGDDELPKDPPVAHAPSRSATASSPPTCIPFWVLSVVLPAALIGAIVLARRD